MGRKKRKHAAARSENGKHRTARTASSVENTTPDGTALETDVPPGAEHGHISVLLRESVGYLASNIRQGVGTDGQGPVLLDGTLGLGGHTEALLAELPEVRVLGLDRDGEAMAKAKARLAPFGERFTAVQARYAEFPAVLDDLGIARIDGALLDLGVSSLQLDAPERGFSFREDGPLDMRMSGAGSDESAAQLVATAPFEELKRIIDAYGEEPQAGRIARAIVKAREEAAIETTAQLAEIVYEAYPAKWRATARNHPATRTFQALRMAVNRELEELETFLAAITEYLADGGIVAIISFHSLEDRMVKQAFRYAAKDCHCPPRQIRCDCGHVPSLEILTRKPVVPAEAETAVNPRARSAKLRVARRIPREEAKRLSRAEQFKRGRR